MKVSEIGHSKIVELASRRFESFAEDVEQTHQFRTPETSTKVGVIGNLSTRHGSGITLDIPLYVLVKAPFDPQTCLLSHLISLVRAGGEVCSCPARTTYSHWS